MKSKIFTLLFILTALFGIGNKVNATTITAVATGNWSATATWDGVAVPTSADSVIVPTGKTVTIDVSTQTCHGVLVQSGGILTMGASGQLYTCFVTVNQGGVFTSTTTSASARALFLGYLYTTSATPQTGDFFIQNDGQFGGTAYGVADGISIWWSELATSISIQGSAKGTSGIAYLGRVLPNNGTNHTGTNNFDLNIKQSITLGNNSSGMAFSVQNNKPFTTTTTRTCTIYPNCTVKFYNGARFHANAAPPTVTEGNIVYNIYGTLDLTAGGTLDLYSTNAASSTQNITINLGNSTDYALLKLARYIRLYQSFSGQAIKLNFNNPHSKVVLGNSGALTFYAQTASKVPDYRLFPGAIRNLSYENNVANGGFNTQVPTTITDTLSLLGTGGKMYVGRAWPTALTDTNGIAASIGRLYYNTSNKAYLVTTGGTMTDVTAPSWKADSTFTNGTATFQCISSPGLTCGTLVTNASTSGVEISGAPIAVTGNVVSNLSTATNFFRLNTPAAITGAANNSSTGTFYIGKVLTTGTFTNSGAVQIAANTQTGDLTNNGSVLNTSTLTLQGAVSGSGTIDTQNGALAYNGLSAQTVATVVSDSIKYLTINNTANVTLGFTPKLGTLNLINGKLSIGANDLKIQSLVGGSSSSYVVTNGTGKLIRSVADAGTIPFPVGVSATSYDPVTVKPTTGTVFAVKVGTTLSGSASSNYVYNQKEWDITAVSPSSTEITLTPSSAVSTSVRDIIGYYVDGAYSNVTATKSGNSYTATFSSFLPFVTGTTDLGTAVTKTEVGGFYISRNGNVVQLNGINTGDMVRIYAANGALVSSKVATANSFSVNLQKGLYLVKVNNDTRKVTL